MKHVAIELRCSDGTRQALRLFETGQFQFLAHVPGEGVLNASVDVAWSAVECQCVLDHHYAGTKCRTCKSGLTGQVVAEIASGEDAVLAWVEKPRASHCHEIDFDTKQEQAVTEQALAALEWVTATLNATMSEHAAGEHSTQLAEIADLQRGLVMQDEAEERLNALVREELRHKGFPSTRHDSPGTPNRAEVALGAYVENVLFPESAAWAKEQAEYLHEVYTAPDHTHEDVAGSERTNLRSVPNELLAQADMEHGRGRR